MSTPTGYVRAGPFGQGVYVQVPTHQFTRRVGVEHHFSLGDVTFWACAHCQTTVGEAMREQASGHPCDGHARCAVCNVRISWPPPRMAGTLLGVLCRDCNAAREGTLIAPPPAAQTGA